MALRVAAVGKDGFPIMFEELFDVNFIELGRFFQGEE
jgi:hypothetical protein